MIKRNILFSEIYAIDTATNYYMIEVGLDHYGDIFNEWDSAPFKRRELDPALALYLEGSSDEIPFRYPVELVFVLPPKSRDSSIEQEAQKGLENSLSFKLYLLQKNCERPMLKCFGLSCSVSLFSGHQQFSQRRSRKMNCYQL